MASHLHTSSGVGGQGWRWATHWNRVQCHQKSNFFDLVCRSTASSPNSFASCQTSSVAMQQWAQKIFFCSQNVARVRFGLAIWFVGRTRRFLYADGTILEFDRSGKWTCGDGIEENVAQCVHETQTIGWPWTFLSGCVFTCIRTHSRQTSDQQHSTHSKHFEYRTDSGELLARLLRLLGSWPINGLIG